jgi:hypothetical protein
MLNGTATSSNYVTPNGRHSMNVKPGRKRKEAILVQFRVLSRDSPLTVPVDWWFVPPENDGYRTTCEQNIL